MMRPSSSASDRDARGLFAGVQAAGGIQHVIDDGAWIRALVEVEGALAVAAGRVGLISNDQATEILTMCTHRRVTRDEIAAIGAEAAASGTPVVPLLKLLRGSLSSSAASALHLGATSQDVVDTAGMLVAGNALSWIIDDLGAAAGVAADLTERHRHTLVTGRTLLQHAAPTTFGLVTAGWLSGLERARRGLVTVRESGLAVQLGGAVGTLSGFGDRGVAMVSAFAAELRLAEPDLPWHTERTRIAQLAGALGSAAGTAGKVARDIVLSAQTEVGELAEGGGEGGSSAMPHKHNPIRAIGAIASAAQTPGLVATLLSVMPQEHQRGAGTWYAEWQPLRALFESTGSAVFQVRRSLEGLRVDAGRMRSNLDLTHGALLAERVAGALRPALGTEQAHHVVREAATGGDLANDPRITAHLAREEIATLLDPATYLGSADALIDRALAARQSGAAREAGDE